MIITTNLTLAAQRTHRMPWSVTRDACVEQWTRACRGQVQLSQCFTLRRSRSLSSRTLAIIAADTMSRGGFELEDFSSHSSSLSEIKLVISRKVSVKEKVKYSIQQLIHASCLLKVFLHSGPHSYNCYTLYLTTSRNFPFRCRSLLFLYAVLLHIYCCFHF